MIKNVYSSVGMSATFRGKRDFLGLQLAVWFHFVKIHLINDHLFCKYFIRLSVSLATNDINIRTSKRFHDYFCCFKIFLLFIFSTYIFHISFLKFGRALLLIDVIIVGYPSLFLVHQIKNDLGFGVFYRILYIKSCSKL